MLSFFFFALWVKCVSCVSERSKGKEKGKEGEGKEERGIGSEALAEADKKSQTPLRLFLLLPKLHFQFPFLLSLLLPFPFPSTFLHHFFVLFLSLLFSKEWSHDVLTTDVPADCTAAPNSALFLVNVTAPARVRTLSRMYTAVFIFSWNTLQQ